MKYLLSVFFLTCSMFASAAGDSNFSLGVGVDHAGLGAKYSINRGKDKYFGSLGWKGFSDQAGSVTGWGLGWEHLVSSDSHSLGTFLGLVEVDYAGDSAVRYHGVALLYNYYFSGFSESSFVLGAAIHAGASSYDGPYYDDNTTGATVKLAYQW
ncbi:hypothetical protein [Microbulbifer sp. THAF38]|uniref:hypothetical protein n=1 Tax=Microbulbifer sp. THAF38 TaxID=2587856 RepID=UPI001267AA48|nr:hypothetical protein [Microbulbifer sp. THAF38]QFT54567.1 hypothetical protein FIU95_08385 [Microbulbifer sp. THAF38]